MDGVWMLTPDFSLSFIPHSILVPLLAPPPPLLVIPRWPNSSLLATLNVTQTMPLSQPTPITLQDLHNNNNHPHSYATRIRQNIIIKPSARLRQSPDPPLHPRKHKSTSSTKSAANTPHNFPPFPPPHIVLHPDDANSKVFIAIGRSFLSVVRHFLYFSFPSLTIGTG